MNAVRIQIQDCTEYSVKNKEAIPGEMLAGGHAGHLREPGGQVGERLEHGLQEGDQVHQPG